MTQRSNLSILHPYTVVSWKPGEGFKPLIAFSLPEMVHSYMVERAADFGTSPVYCYTPAGCMFTQNAILKLGRKLWVEVNA